MKFYETHYEEYIHSVEKYNLHPEMVEVYNSFPKNISQLGNMIIYGPCGVGKYSQVLYFLKKYSPSELKYDKKINCQTDKQEYIYHISDIHYEIDMSMLGCNSKILWHELYFQIVDIVAVKSEKIGVIVCKNFHMVHNELLDIFYSYIQHNNHPSNQIQIKFIFITEHISFIPKNIVNACQVISISRPSHDKYMKIVENINVMNEAGNFTHKISNYRQRYNNDSTRMIMRNIDPECIMNTKEINSFYFMKNPEDIPKDNFNTICNNIIQEMCQIEKVGFTQFRDTLYEILIYNLDVTDCVWYVFSYFIQNKRIRPENIHEILEKIFVFLKYYNNNYRPIYHLESIFFYIIVKLSK
jgi:hypothetical protein